MPPDRLSSMIALRSTIACAATLLAIPVFASTASAQEQPASRVDSTATLQRSVLTLVTADAVDRYRADQLLKGVAPGQSLMLRSASSLPSSLWSDDLLWAIGPIYPQLLSVWNSAIPFSQNNSSMWAGRGVSSRTLLGFKAETKYASVTFAPQIVVSENAYWLLNNEFFQPLIPLSYIGRGYTFPYYFFTFPIDQPLSFGPRRITSFDMGESTALVSAGGAQVGVSNENQWWGPGIRNAILLSNNAPGFPHLFARTGRPIRTPIGHLDVRWLVGVLKESRYFDTLSTNNYRSIASIGATLQMRWDPNLTIGFGRSVYSTAEKWEDIAWRWGDVWKPASERDPDILEQVLVEPPLRGGRDQIFSLFARWVFPKSGAEVYGEWGRTVLPTSLADFLRAPNHTQGYTIGMQWRGRAFAGGNVRVQAEVTQLEQSATFRDGPLGSWYTSSRVLQGYTNRGQVIGAAIGPGASSQFVGLDYMQPSWQVGAFAGRIRWNEDVHSTFGFPEYIAYCNHDITIYPGARGAVFTRFGTLSADISLQNRMNALFQNSGGCPNTGRRLDIRNSSLTVKFAPFNPR